MLDPDPFKWLIDSVMVVIITIFHDFENSKQKVAYSTKSKNVLGIIIMINNMSILFWTKSLELML